MKNKSLLLVIISILLITGCSKNNSNISDTKKVTSINPQEVYKNIIDSYVDYIYSYGDNGDILLGTPGWYSYMNMSELHKSCAEPQIINLCDEMENIRTYLSYTFSDLDNDGIEELIVAQHGSYYDEDIYHPSNLIIGIYYYENGEVKNLFLAPYGAGNVITILEDGYLKYSWGRQGNYTYDYLKKESSWSDMKSVMRYDIEEIDGIITVTKTIPGKAPETHKNITYESLNDFDDSYKNTGKYSLNLNTLKWNTIQSVMD